MRKIKIVGGEVEIGSVVWYNDVEYGILFGTLTTIDKVENNTEPATFTFFLTVDEITFGDVILTPEIAYTSKQDLIEDYI